jgi:hypothetical protein
MKETLVALMIVLCIAALTCLALLALQGDLTSTDTLAALMFSGLIVAPVYPKPRWRDDRPDRNPSAAKASPAEAAEGDRSRGELR